VSEAPSAAGVIGVLGAGTMGSGIAELAARAGARTLMFDPVSEALTRGVRRVSDDLDKQVARGWSQSTSSARSSGLSS